MWSRDEWLNIRNRSDPQTVDDRQAASTRMCSELSGALWWPTNRSQRYWVKPAAVRVTAVMLEQNEVFPSGTTSDTHMENSGHVCPLTSTTQSFKPCIKEKYQSFPFITVLYHINSVSLGFELWVGQNKTSEDVPLGTRKLRFIFSTIFEHFFQSSNSVANHKKH